MSDKKYTCKSNAKWIIDTSYPDYEEFYDLLDGVEEEEYSQGTTAHNTRQYPIWIHKSRMINNVYYQYHKNHKTNPRWEPVIEKMFDWLGPKLLEHGITDELQPVICWYVDYDENGWQELHFHSSNTVTQIIYLDDNYLIDEESNPKDRASGSLYALLSVEERVYNSFMPKKGRTIIMSGDIPHGVYPNKSLPRRAMVIDYIIK